MIDVEKLKEGHAALSAWLKSNAQTKFGTDECRRAVTAHRVTTTIIKHGVTPELRAWALRELDGTAG